MWKFIDENGTFEWENPPFINDLYFPLCNEAGMMSSITPLLHGDAKTSNKTFILPPVTVYDLHNTRPSRNFWFYIDGKGLWSASGASSLQIYKEKIYPQNYYRKVKAGLLWHSVYYEDRESGLSSEILNFVPADENTVEIMLVKVKNISDKPLKLTPTSAIAIYGRSAENIRDHRHVISLVNRLIPSEIGVISKPLIIFDERGHLPNPYIYFVAGCDEKGEKPAGAIPVLNDFIGDNGNLELPASLVKNIPPDNFKNSRTDGQEYVGTLRFKEILLSPGEEACNIIILGITHENGKKVEDIYREYNSTEKVKKALENNISYWLEKSNSIVFKSNLPLFNGLMKWINIQPVLRKIYGCSFLPYHDYGKGGRGWRDLWQDCLSLILQNPFEVKDLLISNFAGVRLDGSNATIIGNKPGEFIADRNNIPRVWMDHGCWPFFTTRLYIDQTGDYKILFENQSYFRDPQIWRATKRDEKWTENYGLSHKDKNANVYKGSILEHIILQNLSSFFNVGEHNIIKLEGADWNDGIDKAKDRGESVAFTAFYGYNLVSIAKLLLAIEREVKEIELFEEIFILLDTLGGNPDYDSVDYKRTVLEKYFNSIYPEISGVKRKISLKQLASDLMKKGEWIYSYLRKNEWIDVDEEKGFFNSYYNNDGERVDGIFLNEKELKDGVRMNLAGQVFTLMSLATEENVKKAYNAAKTYLKETHGGYRLNTFLGPNKLNFGRLFAFAYGEKENGATFCHMAVMFMNALYRRNFVKEGFEVFDSLYKLCTGGNAKIYPGIPEYFTPEAKGMYHYLTGSASWFVLTLLTEIYGVKGELGDLVIKPRLSSKLFGNENSVSVELCFASKRFKVEYVRDKIRDAYTVIKEVFVNGTHQTENLLKDGVFYMPKERINKLVSNKDNVIKIILA